MLSCYFSSFDILIVCYFNVLDIEIGCYLLFWIGPILVVKVDQNVFKFRCFLFFSIYNYILYTSCNINLLRDQNKGYPATAIQL